jgi:stalled ribosome rescue protein Dom34
MLNKCLSGMREIIEDIKRAESTCNLHGVKELLKRLTKLLMCGFKEIKESYQQNDINALCVVDEYLKNLIKSLKQIEHLIDDERLEYYNIYFDSISISVRMQLEKWLLSIDMSNS